jgi:hypothetical protein
MHIDHYTCAVGSAPSLPRLSRAIRHRIGHPPLLALLLAIGLGACGPKNAITETQMVYAAPRTPDCQLQLVNVDFTAWSFNKTWEVLGYISFADDGSQDPMSPENRALARPRACRMGGTAIAIAGNATASPRMRPTTSNISYMVLRPKSATSRAPTDF